MRAGAVGHPFLQLAPVLHKSFQPLGESTAPLAECLKLNSAANLSLET